jgi:cytochrome c55X
MLIPAGQAMPGQEERHANGRPVGVRRGGLPPAIYFPAYVPVAGAGSSLTRRSTSFLRIVGGLALIAACAAASADQPSPTRQAELLSLLKQDCGACHGMTLKGGLGPPLLPQVLKDKPLDFLIRTILDGRPGTPMPPWRPFMTEDEARWLVQSLKQGVK